MAVAPPVQADSVGFPRSYKVIAPGGKYVFVMISPGSVKDEVRGWNQETADEIREIRQTYHRTGTYRNDGSTEPLWTVDWYAYGVQISSDGVHLIRPGPWAVFQKGMPLDLDQEAVSFFAKDELIRTYQIGELVNDSSSLDKTVSHFRWKKQGGLSGEYEYTITTLEGHRFVFDIRSGEIVKASWKWHFDRWGWWTVIGVVVGAKAAWFVWRRRRMRGLAPAPGTTPAGEA
jgi:gamma-glutamylcyclotransferase (GGCT)/AIG2-like uncharacterized protein YtfP